MGREQRFCPRKASDRKILNHRPGDRETVEGRSAASYFIEDNETLLRRISKNVCDLCHLNHKGRLAGSEIVRGTDTRKDAVGKSEFRALRRNKGTCLRKQRNQRGLTHIGGFSGHIGTGNDGDAILLAVKQGVVFDKAPALHHAFHNRMAPAHNVQGAVCR